MKRENLDLIPDKLHWIPDDGEGDDALRFELDAGMIYQHGFQTPQGQEMTAELVRDTLIEIALSCWEPQRPPKAAVDAAAEEEEETADGGTGDGGDCEDSEGDEDARKTRRKKKKRRGNEEDTQRKSGTAPTHHCGDGDGDGGDDAEESEQQQQQQQQQQPSAAVRERLLRLVKEMDEYALALKDYNPDRYEDDWDDEGGYPGCGSLNGAWRCGWARW